MTWNDIIRTAKEGNPAPDRRVEKTPEEWKAILTPEQYGVARRKGTERPFSGELCSIFGPGTYACVCCGNVLFDSTQKFESGTGWPSFTAPVAENAVAYELDESYGMQRVEVLCNVCDAHLGHVFPDGPAPSKLRYCMNSASLVKLAEHDTQKEGNDYNEGALAEVVLGGGCFWCTEAVFDELNGVVRVESGYAGGKSVHPTYEAVCTGTTGHAEVVKLTYDPSVISLDDIIEIHLTTHNPTTLNRQGADVGTQYRSVVFYQSPEEKALIESVIDRVKEHFADSIVTEVAPLEAYYAAEDYHQQYYKNHPERSYCAAVINPKLAKFRAKYRKMLKTETAF